MRLIVLGSGTCVPSIKRNAPAYYLEADGCKLLIDCGSGSLLQLERAGISYQDIDAVFITHRHPDHFADLMPLIQALLATPEFRREKDLFIVSSKGFIDYYNAAVVPVFGRLREFSIQLVEIDDKLELGPFHVLATKTVHSPDSLAYRFEHNGKSVVFTGDADYDQGIIALSQNADILIADCSFPDSLKAKGHMSAKECGLIAKKADVKTLVLSHIYPVDTPDADRVKESGEAFSGHILLADDMMEIEI